MINNMSDRQPFAEWLLDQSEAAGWIGTLAKAAKADRQFPNEGDAEAVRTHLSKSGADGDMFEAVDDAESEWLRL